MNLPANSTMIIKVMQEHEEFITTSIATFICKINLSDQIEYSSGKVRLQQLQLMCWELLSKNKQGMTMWPFYSCDVT